MMTTRGIAWFGLMLMLMAALGRLSAEEPTAVVADLGTRRELFVERTLIDRLAGAAELRLHHPIPREIVLVHDAPWEGNSTAYHSIFQDGDRYRMFYRAQQLSQENGQLKSSPENLCYAESSNGIHWTKPDLGLHAFQGSKANNIVLPREAAEGLEISIGGPAIFRDANPAASPEGRYKTFFMSRRPLGMVPFQSADGFHWTRMSALPTITHGAFDSMNLAAWDPVRKNYRAFWRYFTQGTTTGGVWKPDGLRAIRTATSNDLLHWEQESDLAYGDAPPVQLYENGVAPYHRAPHLFLGFPVRYVERAGAPSTSPDDGSDRATAEKIKAWPKSLLALPDLKIRAAKAAVSERFGSALTETLLMASRDGVQFHRWDEAFLRPGIERTGTWNYGQQFVAWHLVETKSELPGAPHELSLYATEGYWSAPASSLRRFTLRLDGFVSLHATATGGELATKPIRFAGSRLQLNFSTSAAGSLRVELQDSSGEPIPGHSLADCDELFGDTLDRTVTWRGQDDVSAFAGKPLRLRFVLSDADLFAYQFVD